MAPIASYEFDDTTYARVTSRGIWIMVTDDMEFSEDFYNVYKITDNLILLKPPLKSVRPFRSMQPIGSARMLKSKKYTMRFEKSVKDQVDWEDGWEVFIYSNMDGELMLLACPPLDDIEYVEIRGLPGIISLPTEIGA
ncbi:MAG TPA: hypothetical protein PK718_01895 [Candidatus Methanofastidiosa archaeon]|nr:hypothetical protein [Candidatus Methanofastidiosa archaeon]HPR41283.1 hypothetical protein [Candidatus Methanofastidiosa archaeon]